MIRSLTGFTKTTKLTRRQAALGIGALGAVIAAPHAAKARILGLSEDLNAGETGGVSRIIDGDGFVLKSGLSVKLSSIEAPQSALRASNRKA